MYGGTSEGTLAEFLAQANIAMTSSDNHLAARAFRDAMWALVLLHHYQTVHGPLPAEQLAELRRQSEAMLATPFSLDLYIALAESLAEGANEDYWHELSMRRSAVQFVIDDYPGPPVADRLDPETLADLDTELRRLGKNDEQGPIDPAYIPHGLPASHWWWHYPEQFK